MVCRHCYATVSDDAKFCTVCGERLSYDDTSYEDMVVAEKKRSYDWLIWIGVFICCLILASAVFMISDSKYSQMPADLEYTTFVHHEDGITTTFVYGHKDDVTYTETMNVKIDTYGWPSANINEWIRHYDAMFETDEDLDCYEYKRTLVPGELTFEVTYSDLGDKKSLRALNEAGVLEADITFGSGYFSMERIEINRLKEGFTKLPSSMPIKALSMNEKVQSLVLPSMIEYTSYTTSYNTGWVRTITYGHYDDVVYNYTDYWFASNISGWSESDIDYQAKELRRWAANIEDLEFFEIEMDTSNGQFKCWFKLTDIDNRYNLNKANKAEFLNLGIVDGYCSMEKTEEELIASGYSKQE